MPRRTLEVARKAIENNEKHTSAGSREWELSCGVIRCGECGCALVALTTIDDYTKKDGTTVKYLRPYYRCATYRRKTWTLSRPRKGASSTVGSTSRW